MPVPNNITDLSATSTSNSPQGTETVGPIMNQYIQAAYAFIRQIYNGSLAPTADLNFNGKKITNLANGVASTDAATVGQLSTNYVPLAGGVTLTGALTMPNITLNTPDAGGSHVRFMNGNYGAMLRNDGAYAYLLSTASGNQSGSSNAFRPFYWNLSTGAVTIDGTGVGINTGGDLTSASDERLKADWIDPPKNFVKRLAKVKRGTYTRTDTGRMQVGVSAQDMRRILPKSVIKDSKGLLSLAYGQAAMVGAVELAIEHEALKAYVARLEKRLTKLEKAK